MPLQEKYERYITKANGSNIGNTNYYNSLLDINSIMLRNTGTKYINKTPGFGRLSNNYLVFEQQLIDDKSVDFLTSYVKKLYEYTKTQNINFLYVSAPEKAYNIKYPAIMNDYTQDNYNRLIKSLEQKEIPYIDLKEQMKQDNINEEEAYFITDHHWLPEIGFWANRKVCEDLNKKYGFNYNPYYTNLENYKIETYKNCFIGSLARKVGRYFTPLGIDNLDIITPKFETNLTVLDLDTNEKFEGDFDKAIIRREYLNKTKTYDIEAYAAYSGDDIYFQIIKNNLNPNGQKILVIKDSFARTVYPYLALNASEIYAFDMRDDAKSNEDIVKPIEKYINEIKPDYVLIIYSGFVCIDKFDLYDEVIQKS